MKRRPFGAGPVSSPGTEPSRTLAGRGPCRLAVGCSLVRGEPLLVAAVLTIVAFCVSVLPGVRSQAGYNFRLDGLLSNAGYGAAAVLAAARALRSGRDRWAWLVLAAGLAVYEAANLYWVVVVRLLYPQPVPSWSDALYLLFYPAAYVCLFLLLRSRLSGLGLSVWLDGIICGLGAATLCAAFLVGPVLSTLGGSAVAIVTNLAYPVLDLLLVLFVVTIVALLGWRPTGGALLLGTGFLCFAGADAVYLVQIAHGTYTSGSPVDAVWILGVLLMALAAGRPITAATPAGPAGNGWAGLVVPVGWVFTSGLVLALDTAVHLHPVVSWLAFATLTLGTARMVLAFLEVRTLAVNRVEARTDPLTGLANRRALYERVDRLLPATGRQRPCALLLIDLDRFKEINDSLGHHTGDQLLALVGPRIQALLHEQDLLARLGGDEFAIVLPDAGPEAAGALADRLLTALEQPFPLDAMGLHVSASIGIAASPQHAHDIGGLLQRADIAMYRAKTVRAAHSTYDATVAHPSRERLQTIEELRVAVDSEQLVLHYQPKLALASGEITGVEALVRWWHPQHGLRYPDKFLPLVEEAGLMHKLTTRVLDLALDQLLAWQADGMTPLTVAVNLSADSVVDSQLPGSVAAALEARGLSGSVLVLEITEQFLMADRVRAWDVLTELRALGVSISIDDFGTGYSSLAYLRDLPIDELKLDRAFISPLADDARAAALVRSTIDLSHALGLRMVAEGVEDQATWDELARYGCDQIQGYQLARPMPGPQLAHWLTQRPHSHPGRSWSGVDPRGARQGA